MAYFLRDDLHFCNISKCFIFLDLAFDRYFMLEGAGANCFDRFVHNEASDSDLRRLASRGILTQSPSDETHIPADMAPPLSSVFDLNLPQPSLWRTVQAVNKVIIFRNRLKRRSLQSVLAQIEQRHPRAKTDSGACLAVAAAFNRSKRYISAQEICLPWGLAMTEILLGLGIDAKLIFGVTLPFSAHCWVQVGNIVLTDPVDRVLGFTPILVK